jgi:hypothetical protein
MSDAFMNRRRLLGALTGGGVASALVTGAGAFQGVDEKEIPLAAVPAKARQAADRTVPKAEWSTAYQVREEGVVFYELEGLDAKGRAVTVEVTPSGEVNEVETEIPLEEVPPVVMAALKAKRPRFKVEAAHEVREHDKVVGYDFDGKRPRDKEEISVFVSADGKSVEID